jgi:hypothetical protein
VLALAPRIGERDASAERRAALLDALLAARDTLIVTCDGQDVRTGAHARAAHRRRGAARRAATGRVASEPRRRADGAPLVVRHPRHLADRRNLTVGAGSLRASTVSATVDVRARRAAGARRVRGARRTCGAPARQPAPACSPPRRRVALADGPARPDDHAAAAGRRARGDRDEASDRELVQLRSRTSSRRCAGPHGSLLRERLGVRLPRELTANPRTIELWVDDPLAAGRSARTSSKHLTPGGNVDGWLATRAARERRDPARTHRPRAAHRLRRRGRRAARGGRPSGQRPPPRRHRAERPGHLIELLPVGLELDLPAAVHGVRRVRLVGGVSHVDGSVVDVRYSSDHPSQVVLRRGRAARRDVAQDGPDASTAHGSCGAHRPPRATRNRSSASWPCRARTRPLRAERARDALTALVDLALRVRTGPAPLLPRAAWSIDATSDVTLPPSGTLKSDVERDLADAALQVVLGVGSLAELAEQDDGPLEEGLPDAPTPVQRWSLALCEPLRSPFALPIAIDGAVRRRRTAGTDDARRGCAMSAAEHLDLRARLPRGLSAVEASAGTGKTFALTALAVQGVVLDGVRTEQLLVVTFTRAAAAELRGRIRAGLRDATAALRTVATTGEVPAGLDDWLDALCRADGAPTDPPPPAEEAQRRAAAAALALSTSTARRSRRCTASARPR